MISCTLDLMPCSESIYTCAVEQMVDVNMLFSVSEILLLILAPEKPTLGVVVGEKQFP